MRTLPEGGCRSASGFVMQSNVSLTYAGLMVSRPRDSFTGRLAPESARLALSEPVRNRPLPVCGRSRREAGTSDEATHVVEER